jgi:hypothetical protein
VSLLILFIYATSGGSLAVHVFASNFVFYYFIYITCITCISASSLASILLLLLYCIFFFALCETFFAARLG